MKTIRHTIPLLLVLLLLPVCARASEDGTYSDVPESHWAYESIRRASEFGLVGGMSANRFGIGQPVTRAQFAVMLCRLMNWDPVTPPKGSFSDNEDTRSWYYSAVETAYAHGALLKLGDACGADEPLPREEMAAMTVRALDYAALAGIVQDDCPFEDVTINRGYVALAYHMGFMGGVSQKRFAPKEPSTREQAAAVLLRVCERLNAEPERLPASAMPAGAAAAYAEPVEDLSGRTPMCPRAPLENVYAAAVRAGQGGAVVLRTEPYAVTTAADGEILPGRALPAEEFEALRADAASRVYRSARYDSSYLLHTAEDGAVTVVWFESEEDLEEKEALCRLLGIATVYVQ